MAFRTIDEVGAWAQEHGGAQAVRVGMMQGIFGQDMRTNALINEWLRIQEQIAADAVAAEERALREREVQAAEVSAKAAQDSANSAKISARWAIWAGIIALLSAAVAVFK